MTMTFIFYIPQRAWPPDLGSHVRYFSQNKKVVNIPLSSVSIWWYSVTGGYSISVIHPLYPFHQWRHTISIQLSSPQAYNSNTTCIASVIVGLATAALVERKGFFTCGISVFGAFDNCSPGRLVWHLDFWMLMISSTPKIKLNICCNKGDLKQQSVGKLLPF